MLGDLTQVVSFWTDQNCLALDLVGGQVALIRSAHCRDELSATLQRYQAGTLCFSSDQIDHDVHFLQPLQRASVDYLVGAYFLEVFTGAVVGVNESDDVNTLLSTKLDCIFADVSGRAQNQYT